MQSASRHVVSSLALQFLASRASQRLLHTTPADREIAIDRASLKIQPGKGDAYPTLQDGLTFTTRIFDLRWQPQHTCCLQSVIWTQNSFLPKQPAKPLTGNLSVLSELAQQMPVERADGSAGLLAHNLLRQQVRQLPPTLHRHVLRLLKDFQSPQTIQQQDTIAQTISDTAFWSQWLIRGVLFEGKLHGQQFTEGVVPAPLSIIAAATNAALGRQQLEFVYDDYTLKAANLPADADQAFDTLNYDRPQDILTAIANIKTAVGFNDVMGGRPEHNFRFNHVLMEWQMKAAIHGFQQVIAGDDAGWDLIVRAAERAHKVFKTMLINTPPSSYPAVRLPIKGVRGALGTVYPRNGVFYEGIGRQSFAPGSELTGAFVDNEWGQTGANSSMYKFFDALTGVAHLRNAYASDQESLQKLAKVLSGEMDSGELGVDPIDSMQRAFDLLTRPDAHMKLLVSVYQQAEQKILNDKRPQILLQRLRLAYWVAQHRMVHAQYVLSAIYKTQPIGGQSRAQGTGGSTPPFLKLFLDQTHQVARSLIGDLSRHSLTSEQQCEVLKYEKAFVEQGMTMTGIYQLGIKLQSQERTGSA